MSETGYLEFAYDKFIFKVKEDYHYHQEECWAKQGADGLITVGITDYLQRHSGDVAFVELQEAGVEVKQGDEVGNMETIKTTITLIAPVSGVIKEVNGTLEDDPAPINLDPYGDGWIYKIEAANWDGEKQTLMDGQAYLPLMQEKVKQEKK